MREAVSKLEVVPQLLLNDAVTIPQITIPQVPIIKGDAKSVSIAAASIVAKVTRDRMMEEYDKVFQEFDEVVGFNYLRGIHLNDTKKELGSHVDRHDSIGKGLLGIDFFKRFMKDERFNDMPVILETPDESLWADEIKLLRSFEE